MRNRHSALRILRAGRGGLRHAAMLLALFALGGQFLSVAHLLIVPHAVCAEHGELIHLHDGVGAAAGGEHHAAAATTASAYRETEAGSDVDAHEHCLASALRREQASLHRATATLILVPASQLSDCVTHAVALPKPVSILSLAPKSSPPALCA